MKSFFLVLVSALVVGHATSAHAAEQSVTCGNSDFSIGVTVHFTSDVASEIEWKVTRSAPADHFAIVSSTKGSVLWPDMPSDATTKFPFGSYVGKLNGDTVILSIVRDASVGGGGFQWEGVLNFLGADGRTISWGMFCSN